MFQTQLLTLTCYTLPPTQHHCFFRNLPPLFMWNIRIGREEQRRSSRICRHRPSNDKPNGAQVLGSTNKKGKSNISRVSSAIDKIACTLITDELHQILSQHGRYLFQSYTMLYLKSKLCKTIA